MSPEKPSSHPVECPPTPYDIVDFDGSDDPYRPMNWPLRKKVVTTVLYTLATCWISFASAVYSAGMHQIADDFHASTETCAAGISLMVFGFGLGPLIWGPLSEVYGRKWVVLTPYFISAIFTFGTATAKDIQTVLITRFFTGVFGSGALINTGGVMADIWPAEQRGVAIVAYGTTILVGPTLAPLIGAAISSSYLRWRWTEYLAGIVMLAQLVVNVLVIDESYPPVLLVHKARRMRLEGKNWALHAEHEEWNVSMAEVAQKYLVRPFKLLGTPICLLMTIYTSFIYGILYANLESFQIEYQEIRKWGPIAASLPFLALLFGVLLAAVLNVYSNKFYFKQLQANNNRPVPEARLPPMMIGGIAFSAGFFLFGWTSSPHINYWPSIIGTVLIGFGFNAIFPATISYIVDSFILFSASAGAANTFLRSISAGVFPLFAMPMYHNLGVNWAIFCETGSSFGISPPCDGEAI
ncbi:hypothetical protein MW887_006526 [Aspergillus wentii]|nr:hypothetical protein MW887_006526 [Aspergillus wentii]